MIGIGDEMPSVLISRWSSFGPEVIDSLDALGAGQIVLFGVPGAFTSRCSEIHVPGFLARASEIKRTGIEKIVCVAVNDAYVIKTWATAQHADEEITFLADGNGDLARAMGVDVDRRHLGLGSRNLRYVAVLGDGVIEHFEAERGPEVETTSADAVLSVLKGRLPHKVAPAVEVDKEDTGD